MITTTSTTTTSTTTTVATTTTTTTTAAADDGLVLYYTFDEDGGANVIDQSGRNNDAVVFGAARVEDPQRGWVCEFDGLDDYLNCGDKDDFEFSSQGLRLRCGLRRRGRM